MRRASALLVLALLAACATAQPAPSTSPSSAAASPAPTGGLPDFELTSVGGDQVRLSDYLGKSVIVLSFWASWCTPCKTELPHLDKLYRAYKDRGLVVLALAMDDSTTVSQVAPFVHRSDFAFPVLLDTETRATSLYNQHKSAPYTVVIDRTGHIVSEKAGFEPGSETLLEAELMPLLAAPKAM